MPHEKVPVKQAMENGLDPCAPSKSTRSTYHETDLGNQAEVKPFCSQAEEKPEWKANNNGSIPCPPEEYDGCGGGLLELKSIFSDAWVSELLRKAELITSKWEYQDLSQSSFNRCSCADSPTDVSGSNTRKCASREGSNGNSLYCPDARALKRSDLKHFQLHWARGEPIIVRHVLETARGLSWEPMVMWRAVRQVQQVKNSTEYNFLKVQAIDCLDWCEVSDLLF